MNTIIQILKAKRQKIVYLVLSGMLVTSVVLMVAASPVAEATGAPVIAITITDADGDSADTDTETSKTREKTVSARDTAHNSGTRWKYKRIAQDATCDASQMSSGTSTGNTVRVISESYNNHQICFHATNASHTAELGTAVITGIDRTRPDRPTGLTLASDDDSGTSPSDGVTNTTTGLTITGCAETDSTVELLKNGQSFSPVKTDIADGTTCSSSTSAFSIDIDLAERSAAYTISARATDAAGNVSAVSSRSENASITVDTTAPTVVLSHRVEGGEAGEGDDRGTTYLNVGDKIVVTMTFSEAISTQPIVAFLNDSANLGTVTSTGSGNTRTATYTVATANTVPRGDLKYDITNEASITDTAGNVLADQTEKVIANTVVDTTAPTVGAISFTTINDNSGQAAESDVITATMTFSEKISEKSANTGIFYRLGNSGSGTRFSFTNSGPNSGECRETTTANQYECTYTVKARDAGEFQVAISKFTDYALNAGTRTEFVGTITTDTGVTAPSAVTLERGIKSRDTNTSPTFIVTVGESGGVVALYADSSCGVQISDAEEVVDERSPYTVAVQTNDYESDGSEDGLKTIYAEHVDAAGNISACSTAFASYTLDTSPPTIDEGGTGYYSDAAATQAISLVDSKGRASSGSSIYTKVVFDEAVKYRPGSSTSALPAIQYTIGEDEHRYRIVSNASTLSSGRCKPTSADNISNTYICQYRVRSGDIGDFTLKVDTATEDLLEHQLETIYTHTDSIILDNTPPAKPSALDLDADDDSGNITDDNITNKTSGLTIAGCAETDSSVQLYANGTAITNATDTADDAGYTCASDDDSGFSIDISLTEGAHRITAKATDDSNNTSAASDALVITVDTTAPTATLTGMPTGTNNIDTLDVTVGGTDVTHYQHEVLSGTSCANANYSDRDTDGTAIADKITDSIPTRDGSIIVCVVGRDKAGNWQTKANVTTATWTRDRTGPTKPTGLALDAADDTGLLATDGITKNTSSLTITGCAEADSTVEILRDGTSFSTEVTDVADTTNAACTGGTKRFSADISLTDGDRAYLITAKATDQSDNVSEVSDALTITIKTIAPTIVAADLDLATDDDSGTNTSDDITNKKTGLTISGTLSGTPAASDYVQLYDGTTLLVGATDSSFTGTDNSWSVDIDLSQEGVHTVTAKVLDVAGNEGTAASIAITIDTTGPTVSVTQHITSPTSDETPDITIRTSAAGEVSFGGKCADTSTNPTLQTVTAGTHTVTLPELENKTYDDCTVMVRDEIGNLSDGAAIREFVVDNTPPTISSAAVNNAERTETKVTFNERVYAPTAPAADDFILEIGGIAYANLVTSISGIASTKASASQSLILTHSELPTGDVAVKYVKGTNHIFDQIGNTLETTTASVPISATQFALVALHADDDTGPENNDGITRFDGDMVTLTLSLNTGTFTNGDRVRVFMGNSSTPVVSYTISDSIRGTQYIDADSDRSFDITLPKSRFRIGANTVSATYAKVGSIEGGRGAVTTITYDTTAPIVRVRNPNTSIATQKEVSATDNDRGTTVWKYKALTTAVELCNEATMATGTTAYTEGEALTFTDTTDNNNRICFASEDAAGNIGYNVSHALSGIDGGAPTVNSVVATSADGRTMRVTMSERVYAPTAPALNDFKVVVGEDEYSIVGLTGLATSVSSAKNTFTITLPSFASDVQMTLKYTAGTNTITDVVGNPLASFTGQAINNVKLISLALHADDDTGPDAADGITRFDGDEVTLVVSLNEGTFSNGDRVRLFVGNSSTPVRTYTISNLLTASTYKNATGKTSFTVDLPKQIFSRGDNRLSADYTPSGSTEGARGSVLAVTYDTFAPRISVRNPTTTKAQRKTVSATDSDSAATVWQYKQIAGTAVCEEASMTDATSYTEDARTLVFSSEEDNGTKICFSSTDVAGNTAYRPSYVLGGIDTTAPAVSGVSITTTSRTTTDITFTEPVYATSAISPTDFSLVSGQGGQHVVIGITGLGTTVAAARSSITLSHTPIAETATISLRYVKGTNTILDAAGNTLESFTESVTNTPFVTLSLDAKDDTGERDDDDITMFDGDEVSFTVSLTSGTFSVGDQVKIYGEDQTSPLKSVVIASAGANTVNAGGQTSFSITLAKRLFTEGTVTLYAHYAPVGRIAPAKNGIDFSFVYDKTAPEVTVTSPTDVSVAKSKEVSAADDDSSDTVWQYKLIDKDVKCDASAIATDATAYTEGAALDLTDSDLNDKKACFSSSDIAGNTTYAVSEVLQGIDSDAPTVSSAAIENYERTNTVVTFSERVYASQGFSPSAFSIEIGDTGHHYRVSTINNLPTTARAASKTFTFAHPAVSGDVSLRLVYTPGTGTIQDVAGNTLAGFTQNIETTSFITLDLADEDDTGPDVTDNHTRLDGSKVSLTVALTNGASFSNSDVITLYRDEGHSAVKRITVSTFPSQDSVNANGTTSFKIEIPRSVFAENGVTLLSAGYAPFGNTALNKIGGFLQVTVDTVAPRIKVTNPRDGAALQKTVRATGDDRTDTKWKYALIQSGVVCDADAIQDGAEYIEGEDIVLDTEDSNDMKVCFAATDLAGNVSHESSAKITGIDSEIPTVSSVAVTGESVLTVTMSEPVYSVGGPDTDDLVVFINDAPTLTETISDIPTTAARADNQFTITVADSFKANDTISLSYVGSSRSRAAELIKDTIGNALAPFDKISVTLPSAATITLDPEFDTGSDNTDGLTNFGDGSHVKFVVTLSSGVFRSGDRVRVYRDSENAPLVNTRIGIREGEVDARGQTSLTITVPKRHFSHETFTLRVTHTVQSQQEGLPSAPLTITYDTTAPDISVVSPNTEVAKSKVVRAVDDDTIETTWAYKQISSGAKCNEEQMATDTQPYTEGDEISFTAEEDNGMKVCFMVTDLAGNVAYERSSVLRGIDTTATVITVVNPTADPAQTKVVSATDSDTDETTWAYKQIAGDASCDKTTMASGAKTYTEGDEISFTAEDDNGTKVCFSSTDGIGHVAYQASAVLAGIDRTVIEDVVIDITGTTGGLLLPDDEPVQYARAKVIRASDKETTKTTWMYKQILKSDACNEAQMQNDAKVYVEGANLTFDSEDDNDTKVCFAITDHVGNTVYRESGLITGIDTTATTIIITRTADAVHARDVDTADAEWKYKKIGGDLACDAGEMANGAQPYTEGAPVVITAKDDGGKKVCFSVTDTAGNAAYQASETVSSIVATTTAWIDPALGGGEDVAWAQAKAVVGTDGNDTKTTWYYRQIAGDAACDASMGTETATPYVEGTPIVLRKESDNGTKICFLSVDQAGKVTAASSEIVAGIDTTAPTISITDAASGAAKEKVLRAVDHDTDETAWTYKQIAGSATCDANQMSAGAQPYTENTDLTFAKESDNGTRVCFSAMDAAGNTAHQASAVLDGIDATVPTVSSAILVDVRRTQTKVVVADLVSSFGDFSAENFTVEIDSADYPVTKVSRFEQSETVRQTSFVLTHAAIVQGASATLSYTAGNDGGITDAVGNRLESFSKVIFDKSFVSLSLDPKDDTGVSHTDGVTRFGDDDEVSLIATISEGTFSNGDKVSLYVKGRASFLKRVLISGAIVGAIDAHGETSITLTVPKSTFVAGTETTLYTVFTPADGSNATGQRGSDFVISYHKTVPHITVTTDAVSAAMVTVQATDTHDADETVWQYAQIAADDACDASALTNASVYTEGDVISFTDEESNDTKACFVAADAAGNTAYAASEVIVIDLTAPAITIQPITSKREASKTIRATDNDDKKTVWRYRVLAADVACDADAMKVKTGAYKEGTGLRFTKERANGHKVCFSSTDEAGNVLYAASMVIRGIDVSAPSITVTMTGTKEKVVRARDTDTSGSTVWQYRVIKGNAACAQGTMEGKSRAYREGSGLVFRRAQANGHKVCFSAKDSVGNVSYEDSPVMVGIGAVNTRTPSTARPLQSGTGSPLTPAPNSPLTPAQ